MPRYFFDIYDGIALPDSVGAELADVGAAKTEAVRRAGALLSENPDHLWRDGDWTVFVRDESGLQLCSVVILGMLAPALRGGATSPQSSPASATRP